MKSVASPSTGTIAEQKLADREYIHLGCGWCAPAGWRNFDASPALRLERLPVIGRFLVKNAEPFPANVEFGDIVRGLPVPAGSCRGVYSSHVLGCFTLAELDRVLEHIRTYLRPGGVFRFCNADLEQMARAYLSAFPDAAASLKFVETTGLGRKARPRGLRGVLIAALGRSGNQWLWDEKALMQRLQEHGFREIRRARFGDAEDRKFDEVEDRRRFVGNLAIQCVR